MPKNHFILFSHFIVISSHHKDFYNASGKVLKPTKDGFDFSFRVFFTPFSPFTCIFTIFVCVYNQRCAFTKRKKSVQLVINYVMMCFVTSWGFTLKIYFLISKLYIYIYIYIYISSLGVRDYRLLAHLCIRRYIQSCQYDAVTLLQNEYENKGCFISNNLMLQLAFWYLPCF